MSAEISGRAPLDVEGRHPSVQHFSPLFAYDHLPEHLRHLSAPFAHVANTTLALCKDGPELTTALRKLLEAKDCAVRQAVIDQKSGKQADA